MYMLKPVFSLTKNSVLLQKNDCDLSLCVQYASDAYDELNEMRTSAQKILKLFLMKKRKIEGKVDIEMKILHSITVSQNKRVVVIMREDEYF